MVNEFCNSVPLCSLLFHVFSIFKSKVNSWTDFLNVHCPSINQTFGEFLDILYFSIDLTSGEFLNVLYLSIDSTSGEFLNVFYLSINLTSGKFSILHLVALCSPCPRRLRRLESGFVDTEAHLERNGIPCRRRNTEGFIQQVDSYNHNLCAQSLSVHSCVPLKYLFSAALGLRCSSGGPQDSLDAHLVEGIKVLRLESMVLQPFCSYRDRPVTNVSWHVCDLHVG